MHVSITYHSIISPCSGMNDQECPAVNPVKTTASLPTTPTPTPIATTATATATATAIPNAPTATTTSM